MSGRVPNRVRTVFFLDPGVVGFEIILGSRYANTLGQSHFSQL